MNKVNWPSRGGKVARLNAECKAYRSAVREAGRQYDGHNGVQAIICWGKLKSQGDLLTDDLAHSTWIDEQSITLPTFNED